jgi:hypothetical protein
MPRVYSAFVRSSQSALIAGFTLLLPSFLLAQDVTFLAGHNSPASQRDTSVNIAREGDFNRDGKPDLITVTSGTSDTSISILLGNGDGTFQPPATIITGGTYYADLAVGDFNGDGNLDVVALWEQNLNKFSVFLGNGDGTFQNPITTTLTSPPTLEGGLAAADLNGDKKTDLVLSGTAPQQGSSTVLVLMSNGDGTFQPPTSYVVPGSQVIVRVGDFNGDGKPDIVTSGLSVLLGNGNGTFQAPKTNSLSCGDPAYIVVGDFNNDGEDDLAVSGAVALSNGDGTFTAVCNTPYEPIVTADFNNDGLLDLVGEGPSVYLGKGDGTFQPAPSGFGSSLSTGFSAADFDGDGKIDLAGPGSGNNVTFVHGNGDGTFRGFASVAFSGFYIVSSWTIADLRRNGITDLLVFAQGDEDEGAVEIFLGNGNGTFQPTQFPAVFSVEGGAIGDFNNDGKPDLATGGDGLGVMLGNGNGTFGPLVTYNGGGGVPEVGDFNGDGNLDIVAGSDLFLGNGDGTFGFPVTINVGGIVADVNGDGKPDFVTGGGNNIDVYLNLGNLNFQLVQTPLNQNAIPLGLADLNHDGRLDLVATAGGGLLTLLGNGDGTFQLKGTFPVAASSVAFGDFNGDGNLDVATGGGNTVSVLLGNGDGTLQPAVSYDSGPDGAYGVFAADFNGDGKVDLAVMDSNGGGSGAIAILFNTVGLMPDISFSPNSLTFASRGVDTTSPAQKVMLQNTGGAALTISQIALSGTHAGDFAETNNCGSSLIANGSCTISVTFRPTASGPLSANLSVRDSVGNQTVALTGTGAPSLGLGIPSGDSDSATVSAGATAKYSISIGGAGLSGTATLACTGAPAGATCTVPASENVSATAATQFTVSVTTTAPTSAALERNGSPLSWFWATTLFGIVWLPFGRQPQHAARKIAAISSLLLVAFLVSCGGGSEGNGGPGGGGSGSGGTAAGTYNLMVTATMGGTNESQALKLIVN